MADTLIHYHIHNPRSRNVLHKECKTTIGNKVMWRDLYLSCSDIYFRLGSSPNISLSQTQTRTHIYKRKNFIFLGWTKSSIFPVLMPQLCCSSKVWVTLRIPCRQDNTLYTACYNWRITICLCQTAQNTHGWKCAHNTSIHMENILKVKHANWDTCPHSNTL